MLTPFQKGSIAETAIAAAAARLGIGVYAPLTVERYDLILDLRPRLVRVQCKWARQHGGVIVVRCITSRRGRNGLIKTRYSADEIDAIAAYCPDVDRCYFLPMERFANRTVIQLRLEPTRNNQQRGIHEASAFEFAATLRAA